MSNLKKEKIIALLKGEAYKFACNYLGVKDMTSKPYSQVFDVTREEVIEYVIENGLPYNYSNSRNSLTDGFHFYKEDEKWFTCMMERGFCFDEKVFNNHQEGLIYITDMLLKLSGTGLF